IDAAQSLASLGGGHLGVGERKVAMTDAPQPPVQTIDRVGEPDTGRTRQWAGQCAHHLTGQPDGRVFQSVTEAQPLSVPIWLSPPPRTQSSAIYNVGAIQERGMNRTWMIAAAAGVLVALVGCKVSQPGSVESSLVKTIKSEVTVGGKDDKNP